MTGDLSCAIPDLPDGADGVGRIRFGVRELAAYTLADQDADRKLNQNESPFDFPADLKSLFLTRLREEPWHRYPGFTPHRLAERLAGRHGWVPEGVLVGNGSNEILQAVFQVLLAPGHRVVAPAPTFSLYRLLASLAGAIYRDVTLGDDLVYDEAEMLAAARDAEVLVLCTPNNPTGTTCTPGLVERALEETDAFIIVDEAYQEFGGPSMVPLLTRSSRVIVLRTFSKAFGLAGLRCGYGLMHPEVAAQVTKAKLPYNVNRLTLCAVDLALDHLDQIIGVVEGIVDRRARTAAELGRLPGLRIFPSEANFLLLRFESVPADTVFRRLLEEFGILVRDVSHAPGLSGCLRVTIGTEEDMTATCDALRAILE